MESTRTTPGPRICQDLLDCVATLVTVLLQAPASPHYQPTTLSASFAEPTVTSLSPLDAHSIPQVPPSQLWGIKGEPHCCYLGVRGTWVKAEGRGFPGRAPSGFRGLLVLPSVLPIALPFRLCWSLLCSCMRAPSSVWHEYRQPSNDHRAHLSSSKRKWEGRSCCIEGGSLGCSTLPFC